MASGHANRMRRPNTWPHRPTLRRKVFPCQIGAVHTWRKCEAPKSPLLRRSWGKSGLISDVTKLTRMTRNGLSRQQQLFVACPCRRLANFFSRWTGGIDERFTEDMVMIEQMGSISLIECLRSEGARFAVLLPFGSISL
jgi:hypothetical protein